MSIKHEAEVQRQHTRYRIPLKAEIGAQPFDVLDWSLGGLGLSGPVDALRLGRKIDVKLTFPFDVFAMSLNVEAEPVYADEAKRRAGMRFVNLTRQQANILRFVVDAYVSGEVVAAGDILEVSARHSDAKSRPTPQQGELGAMQRMGRVGGRATRAVALTLCSVGLLLFLAVNLKDRLLTIHANSAAVTTDLVTIPAPVGGSLSFVSDQVQLKHGDPIATVETIDGKNIFVNSPCDCMIHRRFATAGDYLTFGTPVVALRRPDSHPYIAAFVPSDRALELMSGWRARVVLADGMRLDDTAIEFKPIDGRPDGSVLTEVIVNIDQQIASSRIGQPARVTFERPILAHLEDQLPEAMLSWLGMPNATAQEPVVAVEKSAPANSGL